jgi:tetratricopeptide (TPR) repeat protein
VPLDHPSIETLDRFLAGTLAEPDARPVVAHLVRRCDVCLRTLRAVLARQQSAGQSAGDYDGVVASSVDRSAARRGEIRAGKLEAAALWAVLMGTPPAQRLKLLTGDSRYHSWELASRLLESAGEYHWQDTGRAIDACRLALAVVERLPPSLYRVRLPRDLRARALGALADALRLDGQLAAAEATLGRAWEALDEGTGDPLELATLLRFDANLRLTLGDFAGAASLLRPAASIYRFCRDRHQEGRTLQKLALAIGYEDPPQGVAMAERALELIDPAREPRLELAARHALIWFLNDCGQGWQALDLLERSRPLYLQLGETQPRLLLPWLEARICRRLGQLAAAERGLVAVWHDFREAGFHQELTLVSLDLAETYIAQGKTRHAIRLLKTFHAILGHWRMHTEGMAAWLLLVEAAAGEAGRAQALTRDAALYFRRAWRRAAAFDAWRGGR